MGVLGGPGAVLVKPWGVTWALLGESWGSLGGPGGSLGDPVGDQVLQTLRTPTFQRLPCFPCFSTNFLVFLIVCLFFFVFVLAMGVTELLLGNLAGPQGMLEGFLGSLGGPLKFLGGSG